MRNERDKAIEAAARALLGLDASDIGSNPRADLRAALALPDAPAPAAGERELSEMRALVRWVKAPDETPTDAECDEIIRHVLADCPRPPTDAPAPAPSERERALVRAGIEGGCEGDDDHAVDSIIAEVDLTHPPTDAAAAERAEIVAMLEADEPFVRLGSHSDQCGCSDCYARGCEWRGRRDMRRDLAKRIAARGPGSVWTEERVHHALELMRDACYAAPEESGEMMPSIADIIARARAGT